MMKARLSSNARIKKEASIPQSQVRARLVRKAKEGRRAQSDGRRRKSNNNIKLVEVKYLARSPPLLGLWSTSSMCFLRSRMSRRPSIGFFKGRKARGRCATATGSERRGQSEVCKPKVVPPH